MSQSDKWLLIYGREKDKLAVASKIVLLWLVKVKVKLHFSAPSTGIAEIE